MKLKKFTYKKAAMFGLDARIALAIFGALSVISGAALYSAIKAAKMQEKASVFTELEKAIEAYLLDTGEMIPVHPDAATILDARELVSSTKLGWKGPYINHKVITFGSLCTDCMFDMSKYQDSTMAHQGMSLEFLLNTEGAYTTCTTGVNCVMALGMQYQTKQQGKDLDMHFDGELSFTKGKIRAASNASRDDVYYLTNISADTFK